MPGGGTHVSIDRDGTDVDNACPIPNPSRRQIPLYNVLYLYNPSVKPPPPGRLFVEDSDDGCFFPEINDMPKTSFLQLVRPDADDLMEGTCNAISHMYLNILPVVLSTPPRDLVSNAYDFLHHVYAAMDRETQFEQLLAGYRAGRVVLSFPSDAEVSNGVPPPGEDAQQPLSDAQATTRLFEELSIATKTVYILQVL